MPSVVRVRPDVAAVSRTFDYLVPELWRSSPGDFDLRVGGRVRVELHGRRVGGWITELDPDTPDGIELRPLKKWSGHGPSVDVIELADWAARHWAGSPAKLLRTASPARNVYRLRGAKVERWHGDVEPWAAAAFEGSGSTQLVAPAADRWPIVVAAAKFGNPLLLVPTLDAAAQLAGRVRRAGLHVALLPDDWDRAASGAVVIGTRAAAFGPVHELGAVVVFDEHDEIWREERTPTWHARDVAIERARRAGVPCVVVSPAPSIDAVRALPLREPDRAEQHAGWPGVVLVDRREEPPGRLGLFSDNLARSLRSQHRVACVLNRTGRVRLLACTACGELTTCDVCGGPVRQVDDTSLTCARCGASRPPVCSHCGSARLKNLVLGVARAREELAALLGERVGEVTATGIEDDDARVMIGTEALLRTTPPRGSRYRTIAFLDFDQHLSAVRQSAEADAMSLLCLAARQVGTRRGGGRILVQTRMPEHRVLQAAVRGDTATLTAELAEQAEAMSWPPAVAQAEVSGAGAEDFVAALGRPLGLSVLGPRNDAWLIRSADRELLVDELARVDRGEDRLRIALH
ncbi:MAG: hypothetical protein AAF567_04030 [Actinomycetota bacterium]